MDTKICGIYKIISPSGKFYVGSSKHVRSRWNGHRRDLKKGIHHCSALQRAADKYGVDGLRHELITECLPDVLRAVEQIAIDHLRPDYNSTNNTREPLSGLWADPEFRSAGRARASQQIKAHRQSPEFCEAQRVGASRALSKLHTIPEFATAHKERATARLRRLIHGNPAVEQKAAEGRRRRMAADREDPVRWASRHAQARLVNQRKVRCVETGQVFESQKAAGEWLMQSKGFKSCGHISNCLAGRCLSAYGYRWENVEADDGN